MIRAFVVGTPRSGTTIFQSFLAGHPAIHTFVESHALTHLQAGGSIQPVHPKARERCEAFLAAVGRGDLVSWLPKTRLSTQQWVNALQRIYDQLALDANKRAWVEKTPRHLHHLGLIDRRFDGARVIHIVRDGPSAVASLFDVAQRHQDEWGERTLAQCTQRWLDDVRITLEWASHPAHLVVRYSELVAAPQRVMDAVYRHLGLPSAEAKRSAGDLATGTEVWKEGIHAELKDTGRKKFLRLSDVEQTQVLDTLGDQADRWA